MNNTVVGTPDLVRSVIQLVRERETTTADAAFIVVTRNDCSKRFWEVMTAANDFLRNNRWLSSPNTLTFVSASAKALAELEDKAPVIEL